MNCENCPLRGTEHCKVVYFNGEPVCNDGFKGEGWTSTAGYDQHIKDTEDSGKASYDCSAPNCLDCERNDECNYIGLFEEASK